MHFSFRKSKSADRLALSRCGTSVAVASVVRGEQKPRVVACARYAFPENTPASWAALAKQLQLARRRCLLLLAPDEYQLVQVEAPNVPAAETKAALRWKLKEMLNYPLEQATIDAVDIPIDRRNTGRGHYMYAVAARSELIKRYMDQAEQAGMELEVIDIPELAQRNIAALLEEEGRGVALLSFNEEGGLLTFTAGGELYHARQVEMNTTQLATTDAAQRLQYFERLTLELQRSLDNFERQFSYVAVTRLVIGPMVGQAALEEYLRDNLYIQVASLDLAELLNLAAVDGLDAPALQAQCFFALGAALRQEAA